MRINGAILALGLSPAIFTGADLRKVLRLRRYGVAEPDAQGIRVVDVTGFLRW